MNAEECPKCGGQMDNGRIPTPLKFLFGYKSDTRKHWSFESNVGKAKACVQCGYLELYIDPEELRDKMKGAD